MKKLALTSLMAVFAVSAANAAVINDNPLYRPMQGQAYSITGLESHSKSTSNWAATEELAYGVTDKLAVGMELSASESNWFDKSGIDTFGIGASYRVFEQSGWAVDVMGS